MKQLTLGEHTLHVRLSCEPTKPAYLAEAVIAMRIRTSHRADTLQSTRQQNDDGTVTFSTKFEITYDKEMPDFHVGWLTDATFFPVATIA